MKLTAVLFGTLVFVALTGTARAASMFAGPLFPGGTDSCECEITNVSTSAKSVQLLMFNSGGDVIANTAFVSLRPGQATYLVSNVSGLQYCQFFNATPAYFRASIACYGTPNESDNVALPAR